MLPKHLHLWLVILTLALACTPLATATPTLTPPPTPLPASTPTPAPFSLFQADLIAAHQNDLALLDRPTRYDLTLQFNPVGAMLTGSQEVHYFNRQSAPLDAIYFRLFANHPDSGGKISVTNLTVDGAVVAPLYEARNTALRVPLAKPLAPDAAAHLHLDFTATIPRGNASHYADLLADDNIVTMPTVFPLIPAYDAKGWHIELPPSYGDLVYADVALFAVTLTVPSAMTVIASGSTVETRDNGDGTTTWRMVGAPMRDFDLNVTARLQKTSATVGETTVNSWHEPSDVEAGKKVLQFASEALRVFNQRFGTYPYRELDVIETPTTAGGIEYPGVIVIGRGLYRSDKDRETLEFVVAHEVAHQWWYAIVGNDQVNAPWVDEALAQYSALIYFEDTRGAAAGQFILKNQFQAIYNAAKAAGRDKAVNQPVRAFDESNYGEIVYNKGPLFFDALRKKMGDALFFQFLRLYFEAYRYKIATPDDVLKAAEGVYRQSLQPEYQQWITSPAAK